MRSQQLANFSFDTGFVTFHFGDLLWQSLGEQSVVIFTFKFMFRAILGLAQLFLDLVQMILAMHISTDFSLFSRGY
jgi:hypothetical protein